MQSSLSLSTILPKLYGKLMNTIFSVRINHLWIGHLVKMTKWGENYIAIKNQLFSYNVFVKYWNIFFSFDGNNSSSDTVHFKIGQRITKREKNDALIGYNKEMLCYFFFFSINTSFIFWKYLTMFAKKKNKSQEEININNSIYDITFMKCCSLASIRMCSTYCYWRAQLTFHWEKKFLWI